jgi:hypothetical protein
MSSKILLRRGTAAEWSSANPILGTGELGIETDTLKIKIGNGSSTWSQLSSYANVTPAQLTSQINSLISAAPATLDTLNELAAAINNDASFSTTVNNLLTGKVSKSGGDTITPSTTSTIGLTLASPVGQTGHLLYAAGGTRIPAGGNYLFTPGLTVSYTSDFNAGAANIVPITVKGAASQTANLQEWQNSAGTVLAKVDANGSGTFTGSASTNAVSAYAGAAGNYVFQGFNQSNSLTSIIYQSGEIYSASKIYVFGAANYGAALNVITPSTSTQGIIVRGRASQTGNLQEWQNSSGGVLLNIDSTGNLDIGAGSSNIWKIKNQTSAVMEWQPVQGFMFLPYGASNRPVTIKGAASQTGNLTEWQNSAGSVLAQINSIGTFTNYMQIYADNTQSGAYSLVVRTNYGTVTPVSIQAAASQTANLTNWTTSSGFDTLRVLSGGSMLLGNVNVNAYNYISFIKAGGGTGGISGLRFGSDVDGATQQTLTVSTADPYLKVTHVDPTGIFIIQGAVSQTANLQEWRDSSFNLLGRITSTGITSFYGGSNIFSGDVRAGTQSYFTAALSVASRVATESGLVVRGFASQTANLQEWQNSAGTLLARIQSDGAFVSDFITGVSFVTSTGKMRTGGATNYGAQMEVTTTATTNIGQVIRGIASQTADLQQFQNSAGTVVSRFVSTGALRVGTTNIASTGVAVNMDFIGPTGIGLVVRGAASQTADLQQWQNSAGEVQISIKPTSSLTNVLKFTEQYSFAINWGNEAILSTSSGELVVSPYGPERAALVVKGKASQTDNLQEWQNSAGTVTARFTKDGEFFVTDAYVAYFSGASNYSATLNVQTADPTYAGLVIRGKSAQTGDLQKWQNSAGTVLTRVDSAGELTATQLKSSGDIRIQSGSNLFESSNTGPYLNFGSSALTVNHRGVTTTTSFIVKGMASQTADLQQWTNSAGTIMATVKTDGSFRAGGANGATKFLVDQFGTLSLGTDRNNTGTATYLFVQSQGATDIGAVVKGAASQTANLQQWQNSSGTVLSSISSSGRLAINTSSDAGGRALYVVQPNGGYGSVFEGVGTIPNVTIYAAAGGVGLLVAGVASQTADLQQWQNNSGTVLAKITASGALDVTAITVNGAAITSTPTTSDVELMNIMGAY